jgi:hypothetical protein
VILPRYVFARQCIVKSLQHNELRMDSHEHL